MENSRYNGPIALRALNSSIFTKLETLIPISFSIAFGTMHGIVSLTLVSDRYAKKALKIASTYSKLNDQSIHDTANNSNEVKGIPCILEVILKSNKNKSEISIPF